MSWRKEDVQRFPPAVYFRARCKESLSNGKGAGNFVFLGHTVSGEKGRSGHCAHFAKLLPLHGNLSAPSVCLRQMAGDLMVFYRYLCAQFLRHSSLLKIILHEKSVDISWVHLNCVL